MSFNKKEWYRLASSETETDWNEALNIAADNAASLQKELLYWFASNTGFNWRFKIFELLEENNRILALELISDQQKLCAFDRIKAFEKFNETSDSTLMSAITYLDRWLLKPSDNFKNTLILEYKNRKKCSMEEAKVAVNRLYTEEPGAAADDISGEGRSDEKIH